MVRGSPSRRSCLSFCAREENALEKKIESRAREEHIDEADWLLSTFIAHRPGEGSAPARREIKLSVKCISSLLAGRAATAPELAGDSIKEWHAK